MSALTVSSRDLTVDEYVSEVLAMPRDHVTNVYAQLYREAADVTWPYEDWEGNLKPGVEEGEETLLSDENVERFAEQDHHDGPDNWAFLAKEEA